MREFSALMRIIVPEFFRMSLGTAFGLAVVISVVGLMAVSGELLAVTALSSGLWVPAISKLSAGIRFFAVVRTGGRYGERIYSHEATFRILARLRAWFFERLKV